MKKILLMAAVLAISTVLTVGLATLPGSIQEAQANPCSTEIVQDDEDGSDALTTPTEPADLRECDFIGPVELDED